jgi:hypothetical protein
MAAGSTDPLLWHFGTDQFRNLTIDRVDVAATGASSPVPPGISRLPGPGEFYVSPALAKLLRATPASELAARFPGRQVGTIGADGLPSPNSLIVVVGYSAQQLSTAPGAVEVSAINADARFGGPNGFDATQLQVILAVGLLALLVPILVFIGTGTRLAAARREQRFASMRLVGATPRQVSMICAVEASVAALAGVVAGFGLFLLLRPALTKVPFTGAPFAPGDLSLNVPDILLVAIGVPLAATVAAHLALRRVQISPLGASRRVTPPSPRAYRLIPLVAGLLELMYFAATGRPAGTGAQIGVFFLGGLLLLGGLVIAGPWLTKAGSTLMTRRTSRPAILLAGRRLGDNPRGAFRAISGLVLALFITSAAIGVISTILDYHNVSSGTAASSTLVDPFESGLSSSGQPDTSLPSPSTRVIAGLRSVPGVRGVTVIRSQVGSAESGLSLTGLVACGQLRQTPALGRCAPGETVATITHDLTGDGALTNTATVEGTVWPTATISLAQLQSVPARAIAVATDGSSSAIEQTRTLLDVTFPFQGPPAAVGSISPRNTRLITELKQMTDVVIVASLVVAACSLVVSVIAGINDRKRPFSLLRLTGVPLSVLRRVVELETGVPLLAAAVLAVATGFLAADLFLRSQLGETLQPPGRDYYGVVVAGLLAALAIVACTLPLIQHITGPDVARNE